MEKASGSDDFIGIGRFPQGGEFGMRAIAEAAVLAGRGNRPHPSAPRGRPKCCRVGVFPPIVHESGTARPDEFSSPGRGPGGMTEHDHLESAARQAAR